jgi:integrase
MSAKVNYRADRGEWVIQCHQHGARWQQQAADEPTARALAKAINAHMRKGEDMRPASKRSATARPASSGDTIRTFGDRWLVDGWAGRKMSTNNSYERLLRLHVYPALGDTPIAKVTREACKAFCKGLLTTTSTRPPFGLIRYKTREAIHGALSAVLGAAVEADLIAANPASRLEKFLKSPDELPDEVAVWTPAEADRFLETVRARRPDYYGFFFVALRTGLRVGELVELQWDLDFKHAHAIHVQRAFATNKRTVWTIAADGTRTREAVEGASSITSPKNKRGRLVDTSAELDRVIAAHRAAQREGAFQRGRPAPSLVFATRLHGNRLNGRNIRSRILAPLIKAARVPVIDIHGLRHTYASTLLSRGERLDYVSRQLGHAHITTTERIYRHWIPDNAAETIARRKRLDEVWAVDKADTGGES